MNRRRAFLPDPAGLCGFVIFLVLAIASGAKSLRDGDTLWHIKFGAIMLEQGTLITRDEFSHTAYGQPWLAHEWLSEIIMAALHGWAGLAGVALFSFAVAGLTFTLLFKTASRLAGDGPALAAVALALPFALTHLLARPHLFTWLGAALTLYLLERKDRTLWLLVAVNALWANLHGGVLFGLVLQAAYLAGSWLEQGGGNLLHSPRQWWKEHRRPALVLLASTLAVGINPFGFHLFVFPFQVASPLFVQQINEWKSPDLREIWYFRVWIVAIFVAAACAANQLPWRARLLAPFLLWQMLGHIRHVSITALLLAPFTAIVLRSAWNAMERLLRRRREQAPKEEDQLPVSPWTGPGLIAISCLLAVIVTAKAPEKWRDHIDALFPMPEPFSQGAVDFLKGGYPGERLFNHYEWGDYLLYTLDPPPKIFIDGRADMYGEKIFSDYLEVAALSSRTDAVLDRYAIDWVVFPSSHPLPRMLALRNEWRTLYRDEQAMILQKIQEQQP